MCGLILAMGHTFEAVARGMEVMEYRGKDGRQGIAAKKKTVLGHVRLAIQDTSTSSQPKKIPGGLLAFVGEIFNVPNGLRELEHVANVAVNYGPEGFMESDGFWSVARVFDNGSAEVFTDHLGIKPIYYWPEQKIICSEITPMFALASPPSLDQTFLSNCIKFGYDYSGRTPYQGIFQLAPGHVLRMDTLGDMRISRYWNWAHIVPQESNLLNAVKAATMRRLVGEREIGLLLSGGLDSSIIYYILKQNGVKFRAVSIENGESDFLPEGVQMLPAGTVSQVEALEAMQAPLDLGSMVPQYALGAALKEAGLNVCLTGDGADELFGGYSRAVDYDSQASDIFCELPYYHLPRLDRIMMKHTVEVRSPYLAPSVIARALSLPRDQRIGKTALKAAARGLVPDRIIDRPKWPLKTREVATGGLTYRANLVEEFIRATKSL